jgi:cytochrome P450
VVSGPGISAAQAHAQLSEEFHQFDVADPFHFYERARAQAAVFYSSELEFWVVPRHADVLAILRDPATFSSENAQAPYRPRPAEVEQVLSAGLAVRRIERMAPAGHADWVADLAYDLPSDLVRVYRGGDQSITREEIAGLVFSQLTAGHETTTALLGTSFLELLRRPATWETLCAWSSRRTSRFQEPRASGVQ